MPLYTLICILLLQIINFFEAYNVDINLQDAVALASGVYQKKDKSLALNLEQTIVVTGCNFAYLNFLHNFKCWAERLDIKFLVISMDERTHLYLHNQDIFSYYWKGNVNITEEGTEFRDKQFNLITNRKKDAVHGIMQLGFNVIFSDSDIVIMQDPVPYLIFQNVDYVHSLNSLCPSGETWNFYKSNYEGIHVIWSSVILQKKS
jgi:hypothetical protein